MGRVWAETECSKTKHGEKMACLYDACAENRVEAVKMGGAAAQVALERHPLPHDCKVGEPTAWDAEKESWCCTTQQICKPMPGEAAEPCNSMCHWHIQTKSCNDRIIWAAARTDTGKATACLIAHELVLKECPVCRRCQLRNTSCRDLWRHKNYFRRYSVNADPPEPHEVPGSRGIDPKLLAVLLLTSFAIVAIGGVSLRCVFGGHLEQHRGYTSARFLMAGHNEEDEEASGALLRLSANGHGSAE